MGFLTDLRFAARQLAAKPGFATTAILTLALGIGASATVFDILSGYLLKSLPYPQAQQLVKVDAWLPQIRPEPFPASLPYYRVIQQQAASFSASAVYDQGDFNLNPGDHARRVAGVTASASLFAVLGTQPLLGHAFTPRNMQPGNDRVVIISWQLWHDAFAGNPRAVGRDVAIEGDRYRIIGVMPRGFAFPDRSVGLWMPLAAPASDFAPDQALSLGWNLIGRLKPGVSIPVAEQRIQRTVTNWNRDRLPANLSQILHGSELIMQVQSWRQSLLADRTLSLWILQAAALLILLITCVNVANLLLSRILGRSHEIALRSTLGATRSMLARQLLGEALCLAVPGGLAGIGLCWLALSFLARSPLGTGESVFNLGLDWRVALFALGTVLFTAMLVSILPIRHLVKTDLQLLLQQGGRSAGGGRNAKRTRNMLAVAELTLAAGLLAVAGLLLHSFLNLQAVDPGFRRDHVLIAGLLISPTDHSGDKALRSFYGNLVRRVDAMPGVKKSGVAEYLPLGGAAASGFQTFSILGKKPLVKGQPRTAIFNTVGPGVFATLGIPILRGRAFDARDEEPPVQSSASA